MPKSKKLEIIKEFKDNQILLLLLTSADYSETVRSVMADLDKEPVCYVTLNKTFPSVKEDLENHGISTQDVVFVDAITKTIKDVPDQADGCYYVSSPGALTEISLTISKVINHGFKYLIFDSLTNLLIYEEKAPVAKFVQMITNKVRGANMKAAFFALSLKQQETLIQEASMFVDNVVDMGDTAEKK